MEKKLGTSTIKHVERVYSKHRAQDIASEYRFQYPGLKELFETFHGQNIKWSRTELEDHWLNIIEKEIRCPTVAEWLNDNTTPEHFIDSLWKVSFLRVFAKTGRKPEPKDERYYLGYYQEPTLNTEMYDYFDIHPMYRACLSIE